MPKRHTIIAVAVLAVLIVLAGVVGRMMYEHSGIGQEAQSNATATQQSDDNKLYAELQDHDINCAQLMTAYKGAMLNGDGFNSRETDAEIVREDLWYAKQYLIRNHPQSAWAQPQYIEESARTVFSLCQASETARAEDAESERIEKVADGLMQISPYSQSDLLQ